MSAWLNLMNKEYRMTRTSAFIFFSVLLVGGLWLVYLSHRYNPGFILVPSALLLAFLNFYPAIYLLKSLSWEWKITPHLWLHCPQPAWMLLSAKLANGLIQVLVMMILSGALLLWGVLGGSFPAQLNGINPSSVLPLMIEVGFYAAVFTFAAGIYMGAWAILVSVVSAAARNSLGRYRWLAGIAVFLVATWGIGKLQQTWIFEQITRWGLLEIKLSSLPDLPQFTGHVAMGQLYAGQLLFYFLLTVALFALSAWLIDHKVEV